MRGPELLYEGLSLGTITWSLGTELAGARRFVSEGLEPRSLVLSEVDFAGWDSLNQLCSCEASGARWPEHEEMEAALAEMALHGDVEALGVDMTSEGETSALTLVRASDVTLDVSGQKREWTREDGAESWRQAADADPITTTELEQILKVDLASAEGEGSLEIVAEFEEERTVECCVEPWDVARWHLESLEQHARLFIVEHVFNEMEWYCPLCGEADGCGHVALEAYHETGTTAIVSISDALSSTVDDGLAMWLGDASMTCCAGLVGTEGGFAIRFDEAVMRCGPDWVHLLAGFQASERTDGHERGRSVLVLPGGLHCVFCGQIVAARDDDDPPNCRHVVLRWRGVGTVPHLQDWARTQITRGSSGPLGPPALWARAVGDESLLTLEVARSRAGSVAYVALSPEGEGEEEEEDIE